MIRKLLLVSLLAFITFSANAAVTGRVVDEKGQPVFDAMINYSNIANRLMYVYTNANGEFSIPAPTEWSLNDLPMYKMQNATGTVGGNSFVNNRTNAGTMIWQKGNIVYFSIKNNAQRIVADLFDCEGKKVAQLVNKEFNKGVVSINAMAHPLFRAHQVYFVRINNGKDIVSFKMCSAGATLISSLVKPDVVSVEQDRSLAKQAAIDGLRAGKTGYQPATVQLTTYSDKVGDLKITSINIDSIAGAILASMSLDQKLGQLCQCSDASYFTSNFAGSFLKGSSRSAMQTMQNTAMSTGAKVPLTIGSDFLHGGNPVYLPHNIGIGASGNPLLCEMAFRMTAMYCKIGNNVDFSPTLDVPRNDKYGRVYEGFSENVDDTKIMARAAVRGLQGTDLSSDYTMIATIKHYAGAGGTAGGDMMGTTNTGDWATLCKIHLPQFHAAVDAGAASVMTAYNNFITSPTSTTPLSMTAHKILITDTLKNGWKFDGFTISDWMQVYVPGTLDRIASGFNAGLDVSMQPSNTAEFFSALKTLVNNNTILIDRVNDAVKRHLRVKLRMNLFANPLSRSDLASVTNTVEYRNLARACVRQSLVLLKNDTKVLPLSKTAKIAVVGVWADNIGSQCGGWSETGGDSWQGSMTNAHPLTGATTIYQALQAVGGNNVTYSADASGINSNADVVVVVVGEVPYAEGAGFRADVTLPADQVNLVQACKAKGKPVVTILITGRPNVLSTIPDNSTALVAAWLPGTEGNGVADVLFGDYDFVGKLRYTWPANNNQEPINTGTMGDAVGSGGTPLFAYGFGLTYK